MSVAEPAAGRQGLRPEPPKDRLGALLILPLTLILIALVLVFFVIWRPSVVVGPSMLPTLRPEDRLLTTRGITRPLRRGDIVVFDIVESGVPSELVKRVVGLPGDRIRVVGDRAWVNGQEEGVVGFRHPVYIEPGYTEEQEDLEIPPGRVYVMGDNRPKSLDSREFGPVPMASVKGRAVAIFTPVDRIARIPQPPD